ncbi:MAG TPA: ABC transporter substrate-binding protein [Herpetosiphonaceae bacterium]
MAQHTRNRAPTARLGGLLAQLVLGSLLTACGQEPPLKLGFAGELTGKQSDLGAHGRDGVQLAVEELNAGGGLAGRQLELVIRDDQGTPAGAVAADQALIEAGVVAIIGHMNSAQTLAGLPVTEAAGMVLLSPVATTPELSGRADHFFRIVPTHENQAEALARHMIQNRRLDRLAVIFDTDNAAFSKSFWESFAESYRSFGGQVTAEAPFAASQNPDFAVLVAPLAASDADGLLIITSALDAALIAQQTRLQGWPVPLFSSAWAQTDVLLQNGGMAVEGMEFTIAFDINSQAPAYQDFRGRFEQRFGRVPTFVEGESYEAALVLFAALDRTGGQAAGLREALLQTQNFAGLVSPITLDQYGDAMRHIFLVTVRDGAYQTLPTVLVPGRN